MGQLVKMNKRHRFMITEVDGQLTLWEKDPLSTGFRQCPDCDVLIAMKTGLPATLGPPATHTEAHFENMVEMLCNGKRGLHLTENFVYTANTIKPLACARTIALTAEGWLFRYLRINEKDAYRFDADKIFNLINGLLHTGTQYFKKRRCRNQERAARAEIDALMSICEAMIRDMHAAAEFAPHGKKRKSVPSVDSVLSTLKFRAIQNRIKLQTLDSNGQNYTYAIDVVRTDAIHVMQNLWKAKDMFEQVRGSTNDSPSKLLKQ